MIIYMLLKSDKIRAVLYGIITVISLISAVKNINDLFMAVPFFLLSGVFGYRLLTLKKKGEK